MAGNTIGKIFTLTTFGESHGPAIGGIVDGCPPGLDLDESDIQPELDRRRPGQSRFTTQRREADQIKILSGVFEGKTTGTSIGLLIENTDQRSSDYSEIKNKFRPGHGDYTYHHKYGIRDYRGGGRASARDTATWVAAGAIAKKYLRQQYQIKITAYVSQIGHIQLPADDLSAIDENPFFCAAPTSVAQLEQLLTDLRREGDSIGAAIHVIAENVPVGLGEPVFSKLDADLAHGFMSINAAKAVEIGSGFKVITQKGSEHRDELNQRGFLSNHAGGILAGISTGQNIEARIAFKPTSSIVKPAKTLDVHGVETEISTKGRHDPCVGIRAVPVVEAVMAIILMDHCLRFRAQCG